MGMLLSIENAIISFSIIMDPNSSRYTDEDSERMKTPEILLDSIKSFPTPFLLQVSRRFIERLCLV